MVFGYGTFFEIDRTVFTVEVFIVELELVCIDLVLLWHWPDLWCHLVSLRLLIWVMINIPGPLKPDNTFPHEFFYFVLILEMVGFKDQLISFRHEHPYYLFPFLINGWWTFMQQLLEFLNRNICSVFDRLLIGFSGVSEDLSSFSFLWLYDVIFVRDTLALCFLNDTLGIKNWDLLLGIRFTTQLLDYFLCFEGFIKFIEFLQSKVKLGILLGIQNIKIARHRINMFLEIW